MIRFSDATFAELKEIRTFLIERMYRHWAVQRMRRKARAVVAELFELFIEAPELMPHGMERLRRRSTRRPRARVVATTSPA